MVKGSPDVSEFWVGELLRLESLNRGAVGSGDHGVGGLKGSAKFGDVYADVNV